MAPDALVEVQHHRNLSADLHSAASLGASTVERPFEPVDVRHLADDDEFVSIGTDRPVVVEAIRLLGITADHMGRLQHCSGDRVVNAATIAGHFRSRRIHDLFLGVIHQHHPRLDALRDDGAGGQRAVDVEDLDPVIVDDAGCLRVGLGYPHHRSAAVERQHQEIVGVGGMDAPFLVRRDEVEDDLLVSVGTDILDAGDRLQVDRRLPGDEPLAEGPHPQVILIKLLAARQCPPRDQLVDVGVAGVVADLLTLDAGPGRRRNDLARLGLDIAEADLLVLLRQRQVGVLAAGDFRQCFPGLDRDFAVGFRRKHEDDFGSIDIGFDLR